MSKSPQLGVISLLCSAMALSTLVGCEKKADPVSAAVQADKAAGIQAPGIEQTKAIA